MRHVSRMRKQMGHQGKSGSDVELMALKLIIPHSWAELCDRGDRLSAGAAAEAIDAVQHLQKALQAVAGRDELDAETSVEVARLWDLVEDMERMAVGALCVDRKTGSQARKPKGRVRRAQARGLLPKPLRYL